MSTSPFIHDGKPASFAGFLPADQENCWASVEFESLLMSHLPLAAKMVRRILRNEADVLDIMQQTALKATLYLPQFRAESSFQTWLVSIALNETRMFFRKQKQQRVTRSLDESPIELRAKQISPEEELRRAQGRERVRHAVEQLPFIYRAILQICELEECSIQQAAQRLQISPAAVKSRRMRARLLLKKQLSM